MNFTRAGFTVIPLSMALAATAPAAAVAVAPVFTVNIATVTKDPLFSNPSIHPATNSDSTTDPQGFTIQREHATAWYQNSQSFPSSTGTASRVSDSSWIYDSEQRYRSVQTADSFHFESTTSIHTTLDSKVSVFPTSDFFLITEAPYSSQVELRRNFTFTLDGPMQLRARFSGLTTNGDTSFKNIFNILALSGGRFILGDRVFMFSATNYKAAATTTFSGGGTRMGVNYQLSGFADDDGIDLTFDLSPEVAGTSQQLEFRWYLPHKLDGGIGVSAHSWDKVVEADAVIRESVTLTVVPETSTLALAALGLALGCRRRREPAFPTAQRTLLR